jgi:hypothetical protein
VVFSIGGLLMAWDFINKLRQPRGGMQANPIGRPAPMPAE